MSNIFERATRQRVRFKSGNGLINVEDAWKLTLTQLNNIAIALDKEIKTLDSGEVSFLPKEMLSSTDARKLSKRRLELDVVKHIIDVKIEEKDKRENAETVDIR